MLMEGSCSCTIGADLQLELFASGILCWAQLGAQGSWRSSCACRVPEVKELWGLCGAVRVKRTSWLGASFLLNPTPQGPIQPLCWLPKAQAEWLFWDTANTKCYFRDVWREI